MVYSQGNVYQLWNRTQNYLLTKTCKINTQNPENMALINSLKIYLAPCYDSIQSIISFTGIFSRKNTIGITLLCF